MKRLLVALAMIALLAAVAAAPAVAKDTGKSDCKNGGWTTWVRADGSAFVDQGSCVSYVAEGGTLRAPTTFQSTCEGLGGGYHAWISAEGVSAGPACTWSVITQADLDAKYFALQGYCLDPYVALEYLGPVSHWGLVGCVSEG
jgi:opacity protein-like surface antigen